LRNALLVGQGLVEDVFDDALDLINQWPYLGRIDLSITLLFESFRQARVDQGCVYEPIY
jgi:hypothetical protein